MDNGSNFGEPGHVDLFVGLMLFAKKSKKKSAPWNSNLEHFKKEVRDNNRDSFACILLPLILLRVSSRVLRWQLHAPVRVGNHKSIDSINDVNHLFLRFCCVRL